jgi:hypothetical protein
LYGREERERVAYEDSNMTRAGLEATFDVDDLGDDKQYSQDVELYNLGVDIEHFK